MNICYKKVKGKRKINEKLDRKKRVRMNREEQEVHVKGSIN